MMNPSTTILGEKMDWRKWVTKAVITRDCLDYEAEVQLTTRYRRMVVSLHKETLKAS